MFSSKVENTINNIIKLLSFRWHRHVYCLSAIFIIFAYGFIEVSFAGDEVSKFSSGTVDSGKGLIDSRPILLLPVLTGRIEAGELGKNLVSEVLAAAIKALYLWALSVKW